MVYFGALLSCHWDRWSSPTCQHKAAFHKRRSAPRHEFQILISVKPIIIWWRRLFSSLLLLGLELYPCLFSRAYSLQRLRTLYTAIIVYSLQKRSQKSAFLLWLYESPPYIGCFNLSFYLHKSILSLDVDLLYGFPSTTLERTHTRFWRFCTWWLVLLHFKSQLVWQTGWGWFWWHTQGIVDAGSS